MEIKDFDVVVNDTIDRLQKIMLSKGNEYGAVDRLHNFNTAAALAHSTPEMALRGMLAKHIVSVWDLIQDAEQGIETDLDTWNEKIIDSINYLIILRAIVIDRKNRQANEIFKQTFKPKERDYDEIMIYNTGTGKMEPLGLENALQKEG